MLRWLFIKGRIGEGERGRSCGIELKVCNAFVRAVTYYELLRRFNRKS